MSKDKLIAQLRKFASEQQSSFPVFPFVGYALQGLKPHSGLFEFYSHILGNFKQFEYSNSQLLQDIFVDWVLGCNDHSSSHTFIEFGATDGLELNNTIFLEKRGWTGVLCEPSRQWHSALNANRPKTKKCLDCVYSESGLTLDFFESKTGVLSTLADYRFSDADGPMVGNSSIRNANGVSYTVTSISLNDLIEQYLEGICPNYISVDTEGSEFDILNSFDFARYQPEIFTVEHNHTNAERLLDDLFKKNNYIRVFRTHTAFDAWYVRADLAKLKGLI